MRRRQFKALLLLACFPTSWFCGSPQPLMPTMNMMRIPTLIHEDLHASL